MRDTIAAEDGIGMVEMLVAIMIITIALLVLISGYDVAGAALGNSQLQSAAESLGDAQLELYASLPYASIGLDETTYDNDTNSSSSSYDSQYASDVSSLGYVQSANEYPELISSCGSTAQCLPIQYQTVSSIQYRIETIIWMVPNYSGDQWDEKTITVIVQNNETTPPTELFDATEAFDKG